MTTNPQSTSTGTRPSGGPSRLSRRMQHWANGRVVRKVRRGKAKAMGMDVLVLHTVGRRSGAARETPLAWIPDAAGDAGRAGPAGARLVVASGGTDRHPDWFANLMAHADRARVEVAGADPVAVTPQRLEGAEREAAWARIAEAQPRIAKYQAKADYVYPVVRLVPRPDPA